MYTKRHLKTLVMAVFLILVLTTGTITVFLPPVFALPSLSGSISSPKSVKINNSFDLSVTIKNSGNTPAYCTTVDINSPYGFSISNKSFFIGDIKNGATKSQSTRVTVPGSPTSGTFSGMIKYFDNVNCKGTSYVSSVSVSTVNVQDLGQNSVTFTLLSNKRVASGIVTIYDSKDNYITTGGGQSTCSACPTNVQVKLGNGDYKVTASGKLDGCRQLGFCNALGTTSFSVNGNTSVSIYLLPIP